MSFIYRSLSCSLLVRRTPNIISAARLASTTQQERVSACLPVEHHTPTRKCEVISCSISRRSGALFLTHHTYISCWRLVYVMYRWWFLGSMSSQALGAPSSISSEDHARNPHTGSVVLTSAHAMPLYISERLHTRYPVVYSIPRYRLQY